MTAAVLAFFAGVLLLQHQAALPPAYWLYGLPVCVGFLVLLFILNGKIRALAVLPFAFAAGFLWAAGYAHYRMADIIAPGLEGRDLDVVGVVASLPASSGRSVRFEFEPEFAQGGARLPALVRLAWYRPAERTDIPEEEAAALDERTRIRPGERWRLTLRLRRPHGNLNPHGFDYEGWLLERGIGATGYVRSRSAPEKLGERDDLIDRIQRAREAVRERFASVLGPSPAAGILSALAVGDQAAISPEDWRLFSVTGVTHLMSISGLHVTLVSGLFAWLVAGLWRRVPALCLRLPARKAAAIAAILGALGYTLIAGYAVPAQRTFYMVSAVALAVWSGRLSSPLRVLALALLAVLIVDPWAPLAPGFWLSFAAVALIFYTVLPARAGALHSVRQWARVQWAITLGLAPAVLLLFGQVSLVGPLANAVAIPLVSIVITPLALIAAVVPVDALLELASWVTERLLSFLEWCANLPLAVWQAPVPPLWAALLAGLGMLWVLAPRGVPWRVAGFAFLAPALALPPSAPAAGEAWITALDVGQGLSVLLRTERHALLYDAGPAYGTETDSGERVIVPVLRALGVQRLDAMVISHGDNDHLGGAQSVLRNLEVERMLSSLGDNHGLHAFAPMSQHCQAGQAWNWDGVAFEMLGPPAGGLARSTGKANNRSCILRIQAAGGSAMLLTGDIERAAESSLLERVGPRLRAQVLLVPHHGSRTSSDPAFIAAVAPDWALVASGYRNRFGHPNAEIVGRYHAAGARVLRTDLDGALHVSLGRNVSVETERATHPRYWRAGERAAGDRP